MAILTPPKKGEKFDQWLVLGGSRKDRRGKTVVAVQCVCGVKRDVLMTELRAGKSTNCGCKRWKRRPGGYYLGSAAMHRDADGSGPRVIEGARPTPGGTVLDDDVLAYMAENGVKRIVREDMPDPPLEGPWDARGALGRR